MDVEDRLFLELGPVIWDDERRYALLRTQRQDGGGGQAGEAGKLQGGVNFFVFAGWRALFFGSHMCVHAKTQTCA